MTLRLGWRPSPPDPSEVHIKDSTLLQKVGVSFGSDDVDLRPFQSDVVKDQIAEDCCAHALRNVAIGTANFLRTPIAEPSVLFPFALARLEAKPKEPLVDEGCSLGLMFRGLSIRSGGGLGYGLIPETLWPELPENINVIPPEDLWRVGENASIRGTAWIPDGAGSRDALLSVLRRGRPTTMAMVVDRSFADVGKAVYMGPSGPPLGGHAMTIVGYSSVLKAFLARNSWGDSFGDGGYCWISEDFVARQTFDKRWIDVLPQQAAA